MKDNIKIERLFQEKLKDFEAPPPIDSWEAISSRLQVDDNKKRVVPFWFFFSNIAAGLLLLTFIGWNIFNSTYKTTNNNAVFVNTDETDIVTNSNQVVESENEIKPINFNEIESPMEFLLERNNSSSKFSKKETNFHISNEKKGVVTNFKKDKNNINYKKNLKYNPLNLQKYKNQSRESDSEISTYNSNIKNTNESVLESIFQMNDFNEELLVQNKIITKLKLEIKKSEWVINKDSLQVVSKQEIDVENPLEKLLKEKEEGKNADEKESLKKWALGTHVTPIYFNSFTEGSPIDPQFINNEKTFANSISYGLLASYELSSKISLRTGISAVNFEYNTNNVIYERSLKSALNNTSNIARNHFSVSIAFSTKENTHLSLQEFSSGNEGVLKQNYGYIEVPLELSYKFLDTKLSMELIGGFSSMFLNQNSVSLLANGMEMRAGKVRNLNELHFSSNFGLGFKYTFWKSFNANFQPMFKYQINPFSENAGNFKPYFIGLYSGISYQF
jgi:hypothetical protein